MKPSLDKFFGVHADAMMLRSKRAEVIASNISNIDTPNYKAKDVDFSSVLKDEKSKFNIGMKATNQTHINTTSSVNLNEIKYRIPEHPSLDGNTVDSHKEKALFADNAVRYQISLQFLSGRISSLVNTLRGE